MEAARYGRDQIAKMLLEMEDIDVNMHIEDEFWQQPCTALQLAIRYSRAGFVKLLVERTDTDVNTRGPYGHTALMAAVLHSKVGAMDELLKHPKIDLNIEDDFGRTALSLAKIILELGMGTHNDMSRKIIEILEKKNAK